MNLTQWWFDIFPYIAIALAVVGAWIRIRGRGYTVSSLSSQFLEGRAGFFGSVPWHYGLIVVLGWHLIAFLFPGAMAKWNSDPRRLVLTEVVLMAFGVVCVAAAGVFILRRVVSARVRAVTTPMDWVILVLLLAQVLTGVLTAAVHRWGSAWYVDMASPYLWSLVKLSPDHGTIAVLPLLVRVHIAGAFVLLALLPFSRLIHIVPLPLSYLWRASQQVIWNRKSAVLKGE